MKTELNRGDIYWCNLTNSASARHQQAGHRPVLIIQSNKLNTSDILTVIVLPITSKERESTEFDYKLKFTKLEKESVVLCDNVQLVDAYKIRHKDYITTIDERDLNEIESHLLATLGLPENNKNIKENDYENL